MNIEHQIQIKRELFNANVTKSVKFRIHQLKKLKQAIMENEDKILEAVRLDLNKSAFEGFTSEIGMVYEEINYMIKNVDKLSRMKRVSSPLANFPSKSYILKDPYGVVLIMAPWNYPFQLAILPLVGAIAAGNTAIIKPSEHSIHTSKIIEEMINSNFSEDFISVINGDVEVNKEILNHKFDLIFFTGSVPVGKIVMEKASKHLTPVILELGGKSPTIIDKTAKIDLAIRRISWGKFLNAGQTCVAPDYLLVDRSIKDKFKTRLLEHLNSMETELTLESEYPKIINQRNFDRLISMIDQDKMIYGGKSNPKTNQIEFTVIDDVCKDDEIMNDEIFGPILPIMYYDRIEEAIEYIRDNPRPLALYLFTEDNDVKNEVLKSISFGGGCINDTISHIINPKLPFGGVGNSGIGAYHGKESYQAFTRAKSIVERSTFIDIPLRYMAKSDLALKLARKIMK